MLTYETVAELLGAMLSQDPQELDRAFILSPENGIQPLDRARLAIACEETFHLSLYDEEIAQWKTLEDACTHIDALLGEGYAEPTERTDEERLGWYYE